MLMRFHVRVPKSRHQSAPTPVIGPRRVGNAGPALDRQRIEIHQILRGPRILAKLEVGARDDAYEREADRVAEEVMRMPAAPTATETAVIRQGYGPQAQRKCTACDEEVRRQPESEEEDEFLQPKTPAGSQPSPVPDLQTYVHSLKGSGLPIPSATRAFFEPRFGYDFSQVRLHSDARATAAAQAANARAFTVGQDIVFGAGQDAQGTTEGRLLLAHELTHVVQQEQAGPREPMIQRSRLYAPVLLLMLQSDVSTEEPKRVEVGTFDDLEREVSANVGAKLSRDSKEVISGSPNAAATDPETPLTGVGMTGIRPGEISVPYWDQLMLLNKDPATTARYKNPLQPHAPGDEPVEGLDFAEIPALTEVLLSRPISTAFEQAYEAELPTRRDVIRAAATQYNLTPELVTAFIMMEQIDQSQLEDAADYAAADWGFDTSIGLGQVLVSTAIEHDLFSDLVLESDLPRQWVVTLLAEDDANIYATAKYMRIVADQAAQDAERLGGTGFSESEYQRRFPGFDPAAYAQHSSEWPKANIKALASEYTSEPWDGEIKSAWGGYVSLVHDYIVNAELF